MHRSFLAEFAARRAAIKQAWERKLRHEPVTSPLANPDTLVLLMDRTLDELAAALAARGGPGAEPHNARALRSGCLCGLNPLLAYFRTAAAVLPAVMSGSAEACPALSAPAYAVCLQDMQAALQALAMEEIRSFCATCQTELAKGGRSAGVVSIGVPVAAK